MDKETYQKKLEARIDELSADVDKLEAKLKSAGADADQEKKQTLENIREKREDLIRRASELKQSSSGAVDDVTEGIEAAWEELKTAVHKARTNF